MEYLAAGLAGSALTLLVVVLYLKALLLDTRRLLGVLFEVLEVYGEEPPPPRGRVRRTAERLRVVA